MHSTYVNRIKITKLSLFLALACLWPLGATESGQVGRVSKEVLVKELFKVMDMRGQTQKGFDMFLNAQLRSVEMAYANLPKEMPDEIVAMSKQHLAEMSSFLQAKLSFDVIEADLASIYANTFTSDEIKFAVDFYQSPLGKSFYFKSIQIAPEVMAVSTTKIQALMPQLMQKAMQNQAKIKQKIQEWQKSKQ